MRAILRQGAALLFCLALLYLGLLGPALSLTPQPSQEPGLDASLAGNTIFMTEPKYIYLNRTPLRNNSERSFCSPPPMSTLASISLNCELCVLRPAPYTSLQWMGQT